MDNKNTDHTLDALRYAVTREARVVRTKSFWGTFCEMWWLAVRQIGQRLVETADDRLYNMEIAQLIKERWL